VREAVAEIRSEQIVSAGREKSVTEAGFLLDNTSDVD
jgi:hypothetical protein